MNSRLAEEGRRKVVLHLAGCKACREEMALLIKLKKNQEENLKEVPQEIKTSAFSQIPKKKTWQNVFQCLEPLYDAMKLVGMTVRFATELI